MRRTVRETGKAYEIGMARFRETSRGHIMGVNSGFLKLIFDVETRRLLGAHIIGEGATELIHIGQAVINLGGTVEAGELAVREEARGLALPTAIWARWRR